MLAPGDLLGDRYRLDEFVAGGGMGQVWRATDTVLGRVVAVKVLLPALLADPEFEARFRAEARIMAALRHPGVVDVYDYGERSTEPRTMYLVMAYVEGEPLSHRIAQAGRLPVGETMAIVAQAADALHAAHQRGVVHRDVKPANLLVQPNGSVTLVDFGVARSTTITAVTTDNAIPGTALYMAPEQASGRPVSAATDVYALGAVAYHCLSGQPPFSADTPLQVAVRHLNDAPLPLPDDVAESARALVERALAKKPEDRFPDAAALAAAARAVYATQPEAQTPGLAALGVPALATAVGAPADALLRPDAPTAKNLPVVPDEDNRRRWLPLATAAAALALVAAAMAAMLAFTHDGDSSNPGVQPTSSSTPTASASERPGGRGTGTIRPGDAVTPTLNAPPPSASGSTEAPADPSGGPGESEPPASPTRNLPSAPASTVTDPSSPAPS